MINGAERVEDKGMGDRFFSVNGILWRVDREMILLLGGGRALLMQLAHPKIAAGVADHSRFRAAPMRRLIQTMNIIWSVVFDESPEALASLEQMRLVHSRIRGTVKQGNVLPLGTPYDARESDLLLWVHATLVDSALVTYELFVGPLSGQEKQQYYNETKGLARLFGVPESETPGSLDAFNDYMKEMIVGGAIAVGSTARALAKEIIFPKPWILKMGGPLSALITTGMLPEQLRHQYGLTWNHRKERMLKLLAALIRAALPFAPAPIRVVPQARAAETRAAPAAFGQHRIEVHKSHH